MFLLHQATQTLIEVLSTHELFDPFCLEVTGQCHAGEELQDPDAYLKSELTFPSGEPLPRCWKDPHYRDLLNKIAA